MPRRAGGRIEEETHIDDDDDEEERRRRRKTKRSWMRKGEQEEEGEQKGQRSLECLSEPLGISLGRFLEASWDVLGVSWRS